MTKTNLPSQKKKSAKVKKMVWIFDVDDYPYLCDRRFRLRSGRDSQIDQNYFEFCRVISQKEDGSSDAVTRSNYDAIFEKLMKRNHEDNVQEVTHYDKLDRTMFRSIIVRVPTIEYWTTDNMRVAKLAERYLEMIETHGRLNNDLYHEYLRCDLDTKWAEYRPVMMDALAKLGVEMLDEHIKILFECIYVGGITGGPSPQDFSIKSIQWYLDHGPVAIDYYRHETNDKIKK